MKFVIQAVHRYALKLTGAGTGAGTVLAGGLNTSSGEPWFWLKILRPSFAVFSLFQRHLLPRLLLLALWDRSPQRVLGDHHHL